MATEATVIVTPSLYRQRGVGDLAPSLYRQRGVGYLGDDAGNSDMGIARTNDEAARIAAILAHYTDSVLATEYFNLWATNPDGDVSASHYYSSPYFGVAGPQLIARLAPFRAMAASFHATHPGAVIGSFGSNLPLGSGPQYDTYGYNPNTGQLEPMWLRNPGGGVVQVPGGSTPATLSNTPAPPGTVFNTPTGTYTVPTPGTATGGGGSSTMNLPGGNVSVGGMNIPVLALGGVVLLVLAMAMGGKR